MENIDIHIARDNLTRSLDLGEITYDEYGWALLKLEHPADEIEAMKNMTPNLDVIAKNLKAWFDDGTLTKAEYNQALNTLGIRDNEPSQVV